MTIFEKLSAVQTELKAPKGQYNSFGKYKYRSCEDILEAVKPLCAANKAIVMLSDKIEQIGDRYYIKSYARFRDLESNEEIVAEAYAREDESKKGMDGSQVTGATSSYARKYALNGLFCIDDTKDADTDEMQRQTQQRRTSQAQEIHNPTAADVQRLAAETAERVGNPDEFTQRVIGAFKRQNENWQKKTLENYHIKSIEEADQKLLENLFNFFQAKGIAI